ncbi:uncharacterized protein KIAA1683 homolog isoform X2 [Heterocephalus glaber]|uniref:Uncharacterized protein KIAA1683 homolog isoform X2 n=1 Tax=Heterocephalus glaber TaxID=10181 RepID=A0AAX6SFX4_HETGA|nr:uncharacterized protein KIAA1683 homolog isoform X2 [Heterocephalus glaber]
MMRETSRKAIRRAKDQRQDDLGLRAQLTCSGTNTIQQATQLLVMNHLSPSGNFSLQPQLTPNLQDSTVGKPAPQPQQVAPSSQEPGPQQPAPHRVPRLWAVVESQAFQNILVDEMDMMHARAATLIQANWRGHRLQQKLMSQMTAARAIQEAWRRFSTRRLWRSSKLMVRTQAEEGNIPYHPPQQVRFQPQPTVVNREMQAPCAPVAAVLPHQATAHSLPSLGSLDPKCQPGLVTMAGRSPHLASSHVGVDTGKCRYVTSRGTEAGPLEPPPSGRYSQAMSGPRGTQAHVEAEPLRTPSQTYRVAAATRTPAQRQPAPAVTKAHAQPGAVTVATKTSAQMLPATAPVRSPLQTAQPATVCKAPSQLGPSTSTTKPPAQMRLPGIITRTPAHIRSVTAVLKMLCLTLPAAGNPRAAPPAAGQAGIPSSSSSLHPDAARTRGPANTGQVAAGTGKVSDLRCGAEGRVGGVPQPRLETGAPRAPTKEPFQAEKTHTGVQKLATKETGSKTNVATQATRALPWAGVSEAQKQPLSQTHLRTEALEAQSQVYMPIQVAVALPQAQVAAVLAKALGQPAKVPSQAHLCKAQPTTWLPATSRGPLPTEQTQALSRPQLAARAAKAAPWAPPPSRLTKALSLVHLVTCLSRAQSQTQLVTDATQRIHAAHQSTDLGSKAQSHPLLTGPTASTPCCRHPGTLSSVSRVKPDHRQGKATQGPRPTAPEPQGTLVSLVAAAAATQPSCNVEPWGDGKTTQAQPPAPSQEDVAASQITALCVELAAVLDSREDLCTLLTKVLSQGEVQAALNQALSEEGLGATVGQAPPQGMLGMALAKALSRAQLAAILPKATSEVASSKMPLPLASAEEMAWDPCLGCPVRPQSRKGPTDTSPCGGQPWNSALPSMAIRPLDGSVAPHNAWQPPRGLGPGGRAGQAGPLELTTSLEHMERIVLRAATIIQACARSYLVRRTIKVWHQGATIIQATWRGHHVRCNLVQLYKATAVIQAAWRGHCVRRDRAWHMQLPPAWAEPGGEVKAAAEHRCFQSCQPRVCSLCRSLSPGLGSPPSVVMLVGTTPRTCHTCGHTLPTRVVHGMGQVGAPRDCASWLAPQDPQERWDTAATTIQPAWKGFMARRQLREQQSATRMLQATWRGHYTRSCLTPEALLATGSPWDSAPRAPPRGSRPPSHWPGA